MGTETTTTLERRMASSEEEERLHEYPNHQRSSREKKRTTTTGGGSSSQTTTTKANGKTLIAFVFGFLLSFILFHADALSSVHEEFESLKEKHQEASGALKEKHDML